MENMLLVGLSRQVALRREMDAIANNVANLNTNGFKAEGVVFEEFIMPVARENQFPGPDRQLSFVQDRATWTDFAAGAVQQTGNPLDIAVDGDAFLVVQTPAGERYTRNGGLQINSAGEIVTSEGHRLLGDGGPIVLQPQDRDISISADGTVSVREGADAAIDSVRGKIRLAAFAQPQLLEKEGSSTFRAPATLQPQPPANARVLQGVIEKSNVRGVIEMTRMIEVSRTYTNIANILEKQGELRRTAIERLAEVAA